MASMCVLAEVTAGLIARPGPASVNSTGAGARPAVGRGVAGVGRHPVRKGHRQATRVRAAGEGEDAPEQPVSMTRKRVSERSPDALIALRPRRFDAARSAFDLTGWLPKTTDDAKTTEWSGPSSHSSSPLTLPPPRDNIADASLPRLLRLCVMTMQSPKPLPSSFGEGKTKGKAKGFQDPFEANKLGGTKPIASPFDMPAADGAKPASPFGATAAPAAPAAGKSPFADTSAFGSAPAAGGSPFAQSGSSANPFGEAPKRAPVQEKVDERSAWEKIPKPAMAQVVIVLSFTTIITLMLATFWVVVQVRHPSDGPRQRKFCPPYSHHSIPVPVWFP